MTDLDLLDMDEELADQKAAEIAERVRDVVRIESSGGADFGLLTLADVFLRRIARQREWEATHDAAGWPLPSAGGMGEPAAALPTAPVVASDDDDAPPF
jgi:hypothetical protein